VKRRQKKGYYAASMGLGVENKTKPIQLEANYPEAFRRSLFLYILSSSQEKKQSQSVCDSDSTRSGW